MSRIQVLAIKLMPEQQTIEVGYNGSKYKVPAEVVRSNMAAAWIEDQLAEERQRVAQRKARRQQSTEAEFASIQTKLKQVDRLSDRVEQQDEAIAAYAAANTALKAQVAALEESGGVLGGANGQARQTAYDLSNATTMAQNTLSELGRVDDVWQRQIDLMQEQIDQLKVDTEAQIEKATKAAATREKLAQERVNRLLDDVARAEARAAKAEAVAAQAERDAQAAQVVNDNGTVTVDQVRTIARDEMQASMPGAVDQAVTLIRRDEFTNGFFGQRTDGDLTRRQRSDATNYQEQGK